MDQKGNCRTRFELSRVEKERLFSGERNRQAHPVTGVSAKSRSIRNPSRKPWQLVRLSKGLLAVTSYEVIYENKRRGGDLFPEEIWELDLTRPARAAYKLDTGEKAIKEKKK